ncbi:hypothetical protein SAMN03159343_1170 [Klenkia marina]|uniref:Uncharacterized protein n=1 Tax=Klenkia marina TaxID=1960309 RepID=A0A1G4XPQ7_9ACTN|nr:hypothetical protein [Klenkia marina]SCX43095.1 hypothetical protein SAMN03159343_1170 [Klenkia marina]
MRLRYDGWILGTGTTSGTRLVVGHWPRSPLGPVSDVMVERPDGHRLLLAHTAELAEFVASTYTFDEVRVVPVAVGRAADQWVVHAGPLRLRAAVGRRPALGWALRAVPSPLARTPAWVGLLDPLARVAGMRTRGTAGGGRTEWYGVQDLHLLRAASASWDGADLGGLARVEPAVRFGFGSVPPTPSVVRVTTTIGLSKAV